MNETYIKRCIELAKKSEGFVSPNPLVGAVVVKEGIVIGEGYHQKCGEAHAEVNALNQAGKEAIGSTLYVSLEPCSHYGKTPPCADLIIEKGVKKVVIGMPDINKKVNGNGIKKLKEAGIEVVYPILKQECEKLNEIFIKNQKEQKPFIAIKTASTMDGKIATQSGSSKWITSDNAREKVQVLRNKYDAILTGSGTIIEDNPSLTCRMNGGRNPIRIIIDSELKTNPNSKVYKNDGTKVFIAIKEDTPQSKLEKFTNVAFIKCPTKNGKIDLEFFVKKLYNLGIYSIIIEAGGVLNGEFLKQNLCDKVYLFMAPKIFGDDKAKNNFSGFYIDKVDECLNLQFEHVELLNPDVLMEGYII